MGAKTDEKHGAEVDEKLDGFDQGCKHFERPRKSSGDYYGA